MNHEVFERLKTLIAQSSDDAQSSSPSERLRELGSPSTSIAILDQGTISSHCISSLGDDLDTLFQACSISKPVAGMVIMKLAEHNLLSIDDHICDRLPPLITQELTRDPRTRAAVQSITIAQLMSHSAGLTIGGFPGYMDHDQVPTLGQIIRGENPTNTQAIKLVAPPGTRFIYSGGGITLLQCIIEQVKGKPYAEVVREVVFQPLEMSRSCYTISSTEKNVAKAYYTGYTSCESNWHIMPEQAAAGLWTTPTDLLKLVKAIQDSLDPDGEDTFLRSSAARRMLTPVLENMGLTWFTNATNFCHAGSNNPGWRSYVFGYAELDWNEAILTAQRSSTTEVEIPEKCGIAIMTNSASGEALYWKVMHAIAYIKGWLPIEHWQMDAVRVPFQAPTGTHIKTDRVEWMGTTWGDQWILDADDDGAPIAIMAATGLQFAMKPAAISASSYENGRKSVDFLLEGLEIMLRLGWRGPKWVVELWNGLSGDRSILYEGAGPS